jgi:hypothetical protein
MFYWAKTDKYTIINWHSQHITANAQKDGKKYMKVWNYVESYYVNIYCPNCHSRQFFDKFNP